MLLIDFETRSPVPISAGAYKYATKAEVLCMGYALNGAPVQVWLPLDGDPFPADVRSYVESGGELWAWNAEFDRAIWNACLDIPTEDYQWQCSATLAAACGLPRGLDNCARCLKLPMEKHADGSMLIRELSVPPYSEDPELLSKMYDYCAQDVEVMAMAMACMRDFTEAEKEDYLVNIVINERGVPVDTYLAELAVEYADAETKDLVEKIYTASGEILTKKSGVKLTEWVYAHIDPEYRPLMERDDKHVLDKSVRAELLALPGELPENVYDVIELSDLASRSSVAKFNAILRRASDDERVRGAYMMNGAAQTGRYSSSGLQMHNLPRVSHPDPEGAITTMEAGDDLPDTMATLSSLLRPAVRASEGKALVWGDWSAIEGRVLPWLARSYGAERKLDLYREGVDVYCHTYSAMFGTEPDKVVKAQRQIGKVAELALGYAGGPGALHSMGRNMGLTFREEEAQRIKHAWRDANDWAVTYWEQLDSAAHNAFRNPNVSYAAGRVSYIYTPGALDGALWCLLPSKRAICYPGVRRTSEAGPYGEQYILSAIKGNLKPKRGAPWPRVKMWKGLLAENITQAVAGDILRQTLRAAVLDYDWPVIGHTHDELILEVPLGDVDSAMTGLEYLMEAAPDWGAGLPLKAECGTGERYGK